MSTMNHTAVQRVHIAEPKAATLLPTYHLVSASPKDFAYSCTQKQMAEQFGYFQVNFRHLPISFDDGHVSQYKFAFPLLEQYGLKGIFFVVVGWIGRRVDYMTWKQVRELQERGHEVQSHGLTHRFLTQCTASELEEELRTSRSRLAQKLGREVEAISIPFGRWDRRVVRSAVHAGYRRIYTSDPSVASKLDDDATMLGRFMVCRSTTIQDLHRILSADRKTIAMMQAKHRCKLWVRQAIGEKVYHHVWGVLRSRKSLMEAAREY